MSNWTHPNGCGLTQLTPLLPTHTWTKHIEDGSWENYELFMQFILIEEMILSEPRKRRIQRSRGGKYIETRSLIKAMWIFFKCHKIKHLKTSVQVGRRQPTMQNWRKIYYSWLGKKLKKNMRYFDSDCSNHMC